MRGLLIFLVIASTKLFGQVNTDYIMLFEISENCEKLTFIIPESLNWYGIYLTDSGEYIREINLSTIDLSKSATSNNDSICIIENLGFWTDQKDKSIMLIGSKKKIEPHLVSHHGKKFVNWGFTYPGQTKTLYTVSGHPKRKSLELNAIGRVKNIEYCPEFEDYQLRLSDRYNAWKSQDISKDIEFMGECNMVSLIWFGDIDFDGVPDLLFSGSSNSRNQYNLFLSSESSEGEFVKLVSRFESGNCY